MAVMIYENLAHGDEEKQKEHQNHTKIMMIPSPHLKFALPSMQKDKSIIRKAKEGKSDGTGLMERLGEYAEVTAATWS